MPCLPQMQSLQWPLLSEGSPKVKDVYPIIYFSSKVIIARVKEAQKLVTGGKFADALAGFQAALQAIPLSVAADATEERNLMDMIDVCREYITFTRMEVARKQLPPTEVARNIEMAAYLTCVKVQSKVHQCLALQLAMFTSFKNQNFLTAASFARRLIQGSWGEQGAAIVPKARQVLAAAEKTATDAHKINFDPRAPVEDVRLCLRSFTALSATEPVSKSPFCGSEYRHDHEGGTCDTCGMAQIGANTLGIQLRPI